MKNLIESIVLMVLASILIVGGVVLWLGIGSGLIEVAKVLK